MSIILNGTTGITTPDLTSTDDITANSSAVLTSVSLPTALNATGSAPIYACRAWVNFNGTGGVAIRASGNVSTITDNGTGDFTVNFTTAMVDANYSAVSSQAYNDNVVSPSNVTYPPLNNNFTTGSFKLSTPNGAGSPLYSSYVYVAVFR